MFAFGTRIGNDKASTSQARLFDLGGKVIKDIFVGYE